MHEIPQCIHQKKKESVESMYGEGCRDCVEGLKNFFKKRVDKAGKDPYIGKCAVESGSEGNAPNLDKSIV